MVVHDEACKQCGEFLAYANAKSLPEVVNRLDSLAYREHAGRHALEQAQAENERLKGETVILEQLRDQAEMYLKDTRRQLEQSQARVKLREEALSAAKIGLGGNHRGAGALCGEDVCTLCWVQGEVEAALAEGDS